MITRSSSFGNIAAGDSANNSNVYSLKIAEDITADTTVFLSIAISSQGHHFWTDSIQLDIVTSIDGTLESLPKSIVLDQNYPNPFNPKTIINYKLPITNNVNLTIHNIIGQRVATLVSEKQKAGYHQVEWDASGYASGVYYYVLVAGDYQQVRKMVLLK
jgi:hypothetical protein